MNFEKNQLTTLFPYCTKSILILLLLVNAKVCAQNAITCTNNGTIFNSDHIKLSPTEYRSLINSNETALKLYNSGRTKKFAGNTLLYGGISIVVIKHIQMLNKTKTSDWRTGKTQTNNILYYAGAGMILSAIPIKMGFSKKIKKSVLLINEDLQKVDNGFNIDGTYFISNANGIGIGISF